MDAFVEFLVAAFPKDAKRTRSAVIHQQFGERIISCLKNPLCIEDRNFRHLIKRSGFQLLDLLEAGIRDALVVQVKGEKEVQSLYSYIPRVVVEKYVSLCSTCSLRKPQHTKAPLRPIIADGLFSRIQLISGCPRHPQSQGLVEQAHYTLERMISAKVVECSDPSPPWSQWLPHIVYTMNTQVHDTTKQTPYELVFGQPPRAIFVPDVNFRGQLDEDVLKRPSEDVKKDKEENDVGKEEVDEEKEEEDEEKEEEDEENEEEDEEKDEQDEEKEEVGEEKDEEGEEKDEEDEEKEEEDEEKEEEDEEKEEEEDEEKEEEDEEKEEEDEEKEEEDEEKEEEDEEKEEEDEEKEEEDEEKEEEDEEKEEEDEEKEEEDEEKEEDDEEKEEEDEEKEEEDEEKEEEDEEKEEEDEEKDEKDEDIAKYSGDVDKEDDFDDDGNNVVEKDLEGTYVGTVASQSECNVEERNKTTAASDLPDSEVCDDHESDYDQDGNNNGHVSA
ncbi:hypothetical protein EMCRGX_G018851 [Ephydatia muelleri]